MVQSSHLTRRTARSPSRVRPSNLRRDDARTNASAQWACGERWGPDAGRALSETAWALAMTVCVANSVAESGKSRGPAMDYPCWSEAATLAMSPLPSHTTALRQIQQRGTPERATHAVVLFDMVRGDRSLPQSRTTGHEIGACGLVCHCRFGSANSRSRSGSPWPGRRHCGSDRALRPAVGILPARVRGRLARARPCV